MFRWYDGRGKNSRCYRMKKKKFLVFSAYQDDLDFARASLYTLPLLIVVLYILLLSHGINLVTADLGRHIENGKLFFSDFHVIATNTYSYTYPDFPVHNHHWLSGVFFYLVFRISGFAGTHLAFLAASAAAFLIFLRIAQKKAWLFLASTAALLFLPVIAERTEVRPEALSYLLAGIFFFLLLKYREGGLSGKMLALGLGLLQALWVNLHIYFFVGWVLAGTFLFESILATGFKSARTKAFGLIFVLVLAASLVNPFTYHGALAPLTIFHEYGYRLVENQPVWFLQKVMNRPNLLYFEVMLALLVVSFIPTLVRNRKKVQPAELIFALGFGAAGALALRNFTIFGLFAFPLFAENIARLFPAGTVSSRVPKRMLAGAVLLVILLFATGEMRKVYAYPPLAIGLLSGNDGSARFFLEHKLAGPVFNNYDIGGYLIHYLYPQEKVFVDNRPEAYPREFFNEVYIPIQENENVWKQQDARFGFNAIVFSYHDYTPWAQTFLQARLGDPLWTPVYADEFVLIFLRRNEKNAALISQFEIARERFVTTPS